MFLCVLVYLTQIIRLCLRFLSIVFGYQLVLDSVESVVYGASGVMVYVERNFDLPSQPGRGHSIYLNIFWGAALAVDTLQFVNVGGDEWFFKAQS